MARNDIWGVSNRYGERFSAVELLAMTIWQMPGGLDQRSFTFSDSASIRQSITVTGK
jgi:hypothetical protein